MKSFFTRKEPPPLDQASMLALRQEREMWLAGEGGTHAREAFDALLVRLYGVWPRRGKKMLVMNAGNDHFLHCLWQAGFDVTAQDDTPEFLQKARESLGNRAEYLLAAPNHLPCEGDTFDYVVVSGFEYWLDHAAVLQEIHRVVTGGVIILFSNAFSLHRLGWKLCGSSPAGALGALPICPHKARNLFRREFGASPQSWLSSLPGPAFFWKMGLANQINRWRMPLPLGAAAGARIDLLPQKGCTGIVIQAKQMYPAQGA